MRENMQESSGSREIEAKVPVADLAVVRARLDECGARKTADAREHNVVFDTRERGLLEADCLLRLRRHNGTVLTFKGPREGPQAAIKGRGEFEVEVSSFDTCASILKALGFEPTWIYEKEREKWSLDDAVVMLDTLPRLGSFVEVEAPGEGRVRRILDILGLSQESCEVRTYAEILADYVEERGEPFTDLVFEEKTEDE